MDAPRNMTDAEKAPAADDACVRELDAVLSKWNRQMSVTVGCRQIPGSGILGFVPQIVVTKRPSGIVTATPINDAVNFDKRNRLNGKIE